MALLFFAGWQLVMPPGFVSVRGLNPDAVLAWRVWLGLSPQPSLVSLPLYSTLFRTALLAAWGAYAGLWWMIWRGGGVMLTRRWTWPLATPLVLVVALIAPANLSTDVYAYVGYARLAVVHGLSPYLHTQAELVRLGDPTAPYLHWPIPSPYGPLWTLITMAVVYGAPTGAVLGPVVTLKLCAGGAVLVAAAAARAIVRRSDPDRGDAAFALVALNPLLLIEGPGNGHNDVVMVALLLIGFASLSRGHGRLAALFVGLSAAVKLVPLIVVPWSVVLAVRAAPAHGRGRVVAALLTLLLAAAPIVAAYAPFWSGTRTLAGVTERMRWGDPSRGRTAVVPPTLRSVDGLGGVAPPPPPGQPAATAAASVGHLLLRAWPALLICLWATLAICLGRGDAVSRLATVWCGVALGIMLFVAGLWFPWYLAWVWPVVVLRFTRPHMVLGAFVLPFSLLLMLAYATPPG